MVKVLGLSMYGSLPQSKYITCNVILIDILLKYFKYKTEKFSKEQNCFEIVIFQE